MKKNTTTNKKRTQVKDLKAPTKEMTKKEKEKVKGGIIIICRRPKLPEP